MQVVFQVQNESQAAQEVAGLSLAPLGGGTESAKFDLVVNLFERLVYLASLRDPDNGRYEPDRSVVSLSSAVNQDLTRWHEEVFREWVAYTLERKKVEIELYIAGIELRDPAELTSTWLWLTPYKNLVPAAIQGPERQKHISDVEAILELLKNVYGVVFPDPTIPAMPMLWPMHTNTTAQSMRAG